MKITFTPYTRTHTQVQELIWDHGRASDALIRAMGVRLPVDGISSGNSLSLTTTNFSPPNLKLLTWMTVIWGDNELFCWIIQSCGRRLTKFGRRYINSHMYLFSYTLIHIHALCHVFITTLTYLQMRDRERARKLKEESQRKKRELTAVVGTCIVVVFCIYVTMHLWTTSRSCQMRKNKKSNSRWKSLSSGMIPKIISRYVHVCCTSFTLPQLYFLYRCTRPLEEGEVDDGPSCSKCGSRWSIISSEYKDYNIKMYPCVKCPVQLCSMCCRVEDDFFLHQDLCTGEPREQYMFRDTLHTDGARCVLTRWYQTHLYTLTLHKLTRRQQATETMLTVTAGDSANPAAIAAVIPAVTRPRSNTITAWKNKYNKVCTHVTWR